MNKDTHKNGYSGTPLVKKLGIKEGYSIGISHPPEDFLNCLGALPGKVMIGGEVEKDFIISFHLTFSSLEEVLKGEIPFLKRSGMIWICWPKKSSGMETELNRDLIREYFLDNGLVDVKIASISELWSGLKFVYRLKDR